MSNEQIEQLIRQYISGVYHMSLGTSRGNTPWVCEVHFSYDESLNLYFRSLPATRHCQDIAANPFVAGNIVEQHSLTQKPRGVYFEGRAEKMVKVSVDDPGFTTYTARLYGGPEILTEAENPDAKQFYKITVNNWYLFDARESKPSQKYHLPWSEK